MSKKFFVYGTLKKGGRFAHSFDQFRTSSRVATLKGFDLFGVGANGCAGFPGIIKGDGEVIGELHEYDEKSIKEVFSHMDMIEGYKEEYPETSLYLRDTAQVTLEDGTVEEANIYIFNQEVQDNYPRIDSGIWPI